MASTDEKLIEKRELASQNKSTQVETREVPETSYQHDHYHNAARPLSTVQRLMERFWLFEIFALIMSVLGLVAVVIILRVTENNIVPTWSLQQPEWTHKITTKTLKPVTVTINSVISLFSTMVKSTVLIPVVAAMEELKWLWFKQERPLSDIQLFTSASKGALGSVTMLWSLRGRKLACLGAVIIVLSLALDFGFQQLVAYPLRRTFVADAPALVARTNGYTAFREGEITSSKLVELPMLAAFYKGLYSDGMAFPMSPLCNSGDCEWNQYYTSLGVCSKCYPTTNQLVKSCSTFNITSTDDNNRTTVIGGPVPYCNYSLPGYDFTAVEDQQRIAGYSPQFGVGGTDQVIVSFSNAISSNQSYFGDGLVAHLASFSVMRASWSSVFDNSTESAFSHYQLDQVNSTECGIDICVIKYQSSVNGTIFKETIVDTFVNTTDFMTNHTSVPLPTMIPSSQWTNMSNDNNQNEFTLDPFTWKAFTDQLSKSFGAVSGTYNVSSSTGRSSSDFISYIRYTDDTGLESMMYSLAQSMTQRMRQSPGEGAFMGPGTNASGVTYQLLPHVSVRWAWIAIPATLVALSAIFLFSTLLTARQEGANMLWKGNALAHFFHPLTKDGREVLSTASSAKHAEMIAGDMKVKWMQTDVGGRFVLVR